MNIIQPQTGTMYMIYAYNVDAPQDIILSERSQTQKRHILHDSILKLNIEQGKSMETESRQVVAKD